MELARSTGVGLCNSVVEVARRRFKNAVQRRLATMALVWACVSASAKDIIITEIMYKPASLDPREEYVELFNSGTVGYNLNQWKFTSGIRFTFPSIVLQPGQYLVVAADPKRFREVYPQVTNVVGGWEGRLDNNSDTITLVDALGQTQASLTYANQGDWGERRRGPDDKGHRGWVWYAAHDGHGSSLELINPRFANEEGQNWGASAVAGGTPGAPNSISKTNIAPIIKDVIHSPAVPRSDQPVIITARIIDESNFGLQVYLYHRVDGAPIFAAQPMFDDGKHGDGRAGDGLYGAVLEPQPHNTIVEFYVSATDSLGNARTWPAPVQPDQTQSANCLYQVSDEIEPDGRPFYRLIMTEAERAELDEIAQMPWYWSSDAQMNATFIATEFGKTNVRYLVGLRMRGTTSRDPSIPAKSRRVNFPKDRPWRGRSAIGLNGLNPHSQVLAGILCRLAGVPAAEARFVRIRENNRDLAPPSAPSYGWYAEVEIMDEQFVSRQFPLDSGGNLYRADGGTLDYLGENPTNYMYVVVSGTRYPNYTKKTNTSENDWSDLILLTRTLNTTSGAEYVEAVKQVSDVDEWLKYFAIFTMLASTETSLATGSNGDFCLYRGKIDSRFKLIARDLDSTFGVEGGLYAHIHRATNNPAIYRFLTHPEFAARYHTELQRLSTTLFEPDTLAKTIDRVLGEYMPQDVLSAMKKFGAERRSFVLSQIQSSVWTSSTLPVVSWHIYATSPTAPLLGAVDASRTSKVLVGGREAHLDALAGLWTIEDVPLVPGINRILVRALDSEGNEVARQICTVWYDTKRSTTVSGQLTSNTVWRASSGPYWVPDDLVIPAGLTLRIDRGTSVFVGPNKRIIVRGSLVAEGSDEQRIRITRPPSENYYWDGIVFDHSPGQNWLRFVEMAYVQKPAVTLTNSNLLIEDCSWEALLSSTIVTTDSSLIVRRSRFPGVPWNETVSGLGIPENGQVIFEENYFAAPSGYADVIDFTGGHRPGPILQVVRNTFAGGGDDGLDLDGTDAHIEGNVFMHFHKDNNTSSGSAAISTDILNGQTSAITVVRNVFYDNDYDLILKDGAKLLAQNNTFAASTYGSLCFQGLPAEVVADGCIWWNLPVVMAHLDTNLLGQGVLTVSVTRSILPEAGPWSGTGNMNADPRFVSKANDFHLLPGSPACGTGPLGFDMGAYVPPGAWITGMVSSVTWRSDAEFVVGGPGITTYKYRVDSGPWSNERSITEPIRITGLANGRHTIEALGKNSAGVWDEKVRPTAVFSWTVNSGFRQVRINEILALNNTVASAYEGYPDLVELYNDSPEPADISGLSLTDNPLLPRKFVFPAGSVIGPCGYLVVAADSRTGGHGYHLGFGLSGNGDSLYLYDKPEHGGKLLDSVSFGLQIDDFSIARFDNGEWALAYPSFGGANIRCRLGDPRLLKINEWLANRAFYQGNDFVELYNPDSLPVALGGFSITDEPIGAPRRHVIADLSFVPARGFVVLIADGNVDGRANHLGFKLAAEQGWIALFSDTGQLIDTIFYGPQAPDVSEARNPSGSDAIVSFQVPTPGMGSPSPVASGAIVINEVMANNRSYFDSGGGLPDWVELYNRSQQLVDLSGFGLSDRLDRPYRWVFPQGTLIGPNEFLIVYFDSGTLPSTTNTGFGLSANGDAVYLVERPGENPARVLDAVVFGIQPGDFTIGRVPDGVGAWTLNYPTPLRPNNPALLGTQADIRINEWMANPLPGYEDWIELYNSGVLPVALSGLYLTDNLADPFRFPIRPLSYIGIGFSAYQVFIADGDETAGANHLNFKLSAAGESIGLADASGRFIDSVTFGPQQPGVSEGRLPDGSGAIVSFTAGPTPGWRNNQAGAPELEVQQMPSGSIMLRWAAVPDQQYRVESAVSLLTPEWVTTDTVVATNNHVALIIPSITGWARYYRVLVIR